MAASEQRNMFENDKPENSEDEESFDLFEERMAPQPYQFEPERKGSTLQPVRNTEGELDEPMETPVRAGNIDWYGFYFFRVTVITESQRCTTVKFTLIFYI